MNTGDPADAFDSRWQTYPPALRDKARHDPLLMALLIREASAPAFDLTDALTRILLAQTDAKNEVLRASRYSAAYGPPVRLPA